MAYNLKRTASMQRKNDTELAKFVKAGTLSSAAAEFELRKRHGGKLPPHVLDMINR